MLTAGMVAGAAMARAEGEPQGRGGAAATLSGLKLSGEAVVRRGDEERRVQAGLFEMAVDGGGTLRTYGVDLDMATQWDAEYREASWSSTSLGANSATGKIRWILQNSYPQVNDLADLARRAGAEGLTEQDAAAGTQVAIWRYSDGPGARVRPRDGADRGDAAAVPRITATDPQAERLADYLERTARSLPEPVASLALDRTTWATLLTGPGTEAPQGPAEESGTGPAAEDRATGAKERPDGPARAAGSGTERKDGGRVGPVTVRSGGERVTVTLDPAALASGVRIVDARGDRVTVADDGDRLYFDLPEGVTAGAATLVVQTSTTVPVGRAFSSGSRSQTQVLAGSSESTVSATAEVNWAGNGPIPAVSTEKDCADGSLSVTVRNAGDEEFTTELMGKRTVVAPGRTRTVPIPLTEDQSYAFSIAGPDGHQQRISGILDCRTRSGEVTGTRVMTAPSPATAVDAPETRTPRSTDLAATGGSAATPVIAGTAITLVVGGGAVILFLRTRDSRPRS
ncbi:thioester domain-containing protein [Streptomyces sp. NPDC002490]|uniref:thioester domain-containing protein n=1 Tax=Streptomyces sp. NPDC002490 TaxID=3154416 RepID=UPI00331CAA1A